MNHMNNSYRLTPTIHTLTLNTINEFLLISSK